MLLIIYTFFQKCNSLFQPFLQDFRKKPRIDITLKQNTPQKQDQCEEVAHAEAKILLFLYAAGKVIRLCHPAARSSHQK